LKNKAEGAKTVLRYDLIGEVIEDFIIKPELLKGSFVFEGKDNHGPLPKTKLYVRLGFESPDLKPVTRFYMSYLRKKEIPVQFYFQTVVPMPKGMVYYRP
jgi:hypothetical protein